MISALSAESDVVYEAEVFSVYLLDPAPRTRWSSFQPPHMGSLCPDAVYFAPRPWESKKKAIGHFPPLIADATEVLKS